jgi:RNA methyltransferase, TrmH family
VATNLQIKFIKSLQLKKNRYEEQLYICEGEKIVEELIRYNTENIDTIYATQAWAETHVSIKDKIEISSVKELEKMSSLTTPALVLATVRFSKSSSINIHPKVNIYLDQISDPGNLGTIIRTADWYGLSTLFLSPNCVDQYSPKVIQAAMGSHFRIRCEIIEFQELISKNKFDHIYATAMEGENLNSISSVGTKLVIMGSESHGVSSEIFVLAPQKLTIPSYGQTESLNVSVATGIILHQLIVHDE